MRFRRAQEALLTLSDDDVDAILKEETITIDLEGERLDVTPDMVDVRIESKEGFNVGMQNNKFVILSTEQFKPEYQNAKNQLFYAKGGFGCYPDKLGGKVFGNLFDESYQTRREYILGVATEKAIVEWETEYGMSREVFIKG